MKPIVPLSRSQVVIPRRPIPPAPVAGPAPGAAAPAQGSPSPTTPASAPTSSLSILGVGNGFTGPAGTFTVNVAPSDANGAVGGTQYVQWVNTSFAVFNKSTGAVVYG